MTTINKLTERPLTANLKNIPAYDGIAYGITMPTARGTQTDVLIVGPDAASVTAAIKSAWPGAPVDQDKMSRVVVLGGKEIAEAEDDEL